MQKTTLTTHIVNPIQIGEGGGGGILPAVTLNVNNFSNIETNATKLGKFS